MSKLYIQPPGHNNFNEFLEYAKRYNYNLEIASFAYSNILDTDWQEILKDHQQKLKDFRGKISLHGVFRDLVIHSSDEKIREISENRIIQNLEIAKTLDAKYIVFHGNFNPLIAHESYKQNWVKQNSSFWSKILNKYQITILIENLWEPTPEIFRKLLVEVKFPRLKICFDTGHANIFSNVSMREWFNVLDKNIEYIHVNDNMGSVDNELVAGEGNINWQKFSDVIEELRLTPEIVFEVGNLEKTKKSISFFQKNNLYPFNGRNK